MAQVQEKHEFALKHAFGPARWQTYFGDVGEVPPLPNRMDEILRSPCPIWKGRKTWETHKLFLVPNRLLGEPMSLDLIGEVVQAPKEGHKAGYLYYSGPVKADIGDSSVEQAHWCLMTKDILPGSTDKDYRDQCGFMEEFRSRLDLPYAIPSTTEATLCVFLHYVETGERIFARNDAQKTWTFTRCSDEVSAEQWAVAVGGFESRGLLVYRSPDYLFDRHFTGVAGVRRF
jgi:hypothetical protein